MEFVVGERETYEDGVLVGRDSSTMVGEVVGITSTRLGEAVGGVESNSNEGCEVGLFDG
jgi:hypothetical protein